MVKLGWIVLILMVMVVLADSATTTKRPIKSRARKTLLSKSLSSANSSISSPESSTGANPSKKVRPVTKKVQISSPKIQSQSSNAQPDNTTSAVRRNPASLQISFPDIKPTRVNPSRLREDMSELGLDDPVNANDDLNNLNAMGTNGRQPPRSSQRRPVPPRRTPAFDPYTDYEDLLFDEYDEPLEDNQLLAEASPSRGRYLQSEVCGRKLYCQRGNRGPCNRNEVFLPQLNTTNMTVTRPSCGNLLTTPWNGCLSSSRVGVSATNAAATGSCAIRFPQRPCYGYPTNYRYYSPNRRCYPVTNSWELGVLSSGPCPLNKVFMDIDGINGMCQCRDRNQLLYKGDDRCHRIYAKGPCYRGKWLEPDTNGYGVCRPSPCPESKCDGRHIYWKPTPNADGGCYKSFTRGPCRRGSYFLVEDYGTRRGRCVSQYGSSFNPMSPYALPPQYPLMRNSYDMMFSNNMMSPWSKFGMYPPFGLQQDFQEDQVDDYDELPSLTDY